MNLYVNYNCIRIIIVCDFRIEQLLIPIISSGSRIAADNTGLSVVAHLQRFRNRN
jgi:hypothetical protein